MSLHVTVNNEFGWVREESSGSTAKMWSWRGAMSLRKGDLAESMSVDSTSPGDQQSVSDKLRLAINQERLLSVLTNSYTQLKDAVDEEFGGDILSVQSSLETEPEFSEYDGGQEIEAASGIDADELNSDEDANSTSDGRSPLATYREEVPPHFPGASRVGGGKLRLASTFTGGEHVPRNLSLTVHRAVSTGEAVPTGVWGDSRERRKPLRSMDELMKEADLINYLRQPPETPTRRPLRMAADVNSIVGLQAPFMFEGESCFTMVDKDDGSCYMDEGNRTNAAEGRDRPVGGFCGPFRPVKAGFRKTWDAVRKMTPAKCAS
mmetsp:Transcript_9429/g.28471  ORF Transcript_9429/g.28471 Transcript_9429/m.28471 type:complete len:320 (+) Transcript_9429:63-1022(+)